jgi:hypothetical protein
MIVITLTTLNCLFSKCFENGVDQLVSFLNGEKDQQISDKTIYNTVNKRAVK